MLNLQTHNVVKLRLQDEVLEQSNSASYHRLESHQSQAMEEKVLCRQIPGRERNLMNTSNPSKG